MQALAFTHTCTQLNLHAGSYASTLSCIRAYSCVHKIANTSTQSHVHSRAYTYTHSHTRGHKHTRTRARYFHCYMHSACVTYKNSFHWARLLFRLSFLRWALSNRFVAALNGVPTALVYLMTRLFTCTYVIAIMSVVLT